MYAYGVRFMISFSLPRIISKLLKVFYVVVLILVQEKLQTTCWSENELGD